MRFSPTTRRSAAIALWVIALASPIGVQFHSRPVLVGDATLVNGDVVVGQRLLRTRLY